MQHGLEPHMIVVRFQQTFPLRVAEWAAAGILISMGVVLMLNPGIFTMVQHEAMRRLAPQPVWGFACFMIGLARFIALVINGAWRASPHIRAACAFLSCFVWLQFALGLAASAVVTTGLAVYPWLLLLDTYNVFRASADARLADERARMKTPQ